MSKYEMFIPATTHTPLLENPVSASVKDVTLNKNLTRKLLLHYLVTLNPTQPIQLDRKIIHF